MERRVLRYFLTVAEEENITAAAKLHVTQTNAFQTAYGFGGRAWQTTICC